MDRGRHEEGVGGPLPLDQVQHARGSLSPTMMMRPPATMLPEPLVLPTWNRGIATTVTDSWHQG